MSTDIIWIVGIRARLLNVGDIIESTDYYKSTSGAWEPAPIFGIQVIDNGVLWARPVPF